MSFFFFFLFIYFYFCFQYCIAFYCLFCTLHLRFASCIDNYISYHIIIIIIIIINDIYRAQNSQVQQMRQVSCCMITVILEEQEHFQSFPEHWEWNVRQTEFGWKTVPHDWSVDGKTAVSVVCLRTWNSELAGLSRAQVTPTAVWWRWLTTMSLLLLTCTCLSVNWRHRWQLIESISCHKQCLNFSLVLV